MNPLISIVLCTYNNADSLEITLKQLTNLNCQEQKLHEIIIVDNNSPDHTAAVVQKYTHLDNSAFHYYFEQKQGLSHARNTGLVQARGKYILFTDDDAEIYPHWLDAYIGIIRAHSPDCLYSKINIIWDSPQPWWFLPAYIPCFVGLDYGNTLIDVVDIHHEFYGKNFCVQKSLLQELGGFDPKLGRQGTKLAAGEETLLYRKLIETEKKVIYFPDAEVGHRLKKREYTREHIKKLYIDGAYSSHHIATITARKKILGRPAHLVVNAVKNLLIALIQYPLNVIKMNKARSYYHYLCICKNITLIRLWISNQ